MSADVLPANLDCERMVLGTLLKTPESLNVAVGVLTPDDFSLEKHRRIYAHIAELCRAGVAIDYVTLANSLQAAGQLESVDGVSYLLELDRDMPTLVSIDGYVSILRDKALARQLILTAQIIQNRAALGEDPGTLLEELKATGSRLAQRKASNFQTPAEIIEAAGVDEFFHPKHSLGIETPIPWLSEQMRFAKGTQTVLAAPTGGGKSAFAKQCMYEAAMRRYRTAIYSLETSNVENLRLLIGQIAEVNMHRMRRNVADDQEYAQSREALMTVTDALNEFLLFRDLPSGVMDIVSDLQRLEMSGTPAHFVIVDYLQIMRGTEKYSSRAQQVSAFSRGLKNEVATRFKLPTLVLSQFSRQKASDDVPELSWLKESGDIENDADAIVFLWPRRREDEDRDPREYRMFLKKNRNGPIGQCDLLFKKKYTRFYQA